MTKQDLQHRLAKHDLTLRLRAMNITAKQLGNRLGKAWRTVSYAAATNSLYLTALIDALEIMTPEQRAEWLGDPPSGGGA